MALLFHAAYQIAVVAGSRQAVSVTLQSAVFPYTASAYLNYWEIWSLCCRRQLLLLVLFKALQFKSIRLDPHPAWSPEVTGSYATEECFLVGSKNCCFLLLVFDFFLALDFCS